nr:unnamed protein product [Callosobruchus chinensis]
MEINAWFWVWTGGGEIDVYIACICDVIWAAFCVDATPYSVSKEQCARDFQSAIYYRVIEVCGAFRTPKTASDWRIEAMGVMNKAFDTLNHKLLVAKCHYYGFDEVACNFIRLYLKGRRQKVSTVVRDYNRIGSATGFRFGTTTIYSLYCRSTRYTVRHGFPVRLKLYQRLVSTDIILQDSEKE